MKTNEIKSGRGLGKLVVLLALIIAMIFAVIIVAKETSSPSKKEYARAEGMIRMGRAQEAAAILKNIIRQDPSFERAWESLLHVEPTAENCINTANNFPEMFDAYQPTTDTALLVPVSARRGQMLEKMLAVYKVTLKMMQDAKEGTDEWVILNDFNGRQEIADAWLILDEVREAIDAKLSEPLLPNQARMFNAYDIKGAANLIMEMREVFPDSNDWMNLIKKLDLAESQYNSGRQKLDEIAKLRPDFLPAKLTLAYINITCGRASEAGKILHPFIKDGIISGELRLRQCLARVHEIRGEYEQAWQQLAVLTDKNPNDFDTLDRFATLCLRSGRIELAEEITQKLTEGSKYETRGWYVRGMTKFHKGEYKDAAQYISSGISNQPFNLEQRQDLALALRYAEQPAMSSRQFLSLANKTHEPWWPLAAAAATALEAGLAQQAGDIARLILKDTEGIKQHPKLLPYAIRFKIASESMSGPTDEEKSPLALISEHGKEDVQLLYYMASGIWAAQASAYHKYPTPEQLSVLNENGPSAKYSLAYIYLAEGDVGKGIEILEELNAGNPRHVLSALHLARIRLLNGRTAEAAQILRNSDANSPDIASAIALVDSLQGITTAKQIPHRTFLPGPHLAFFAISIDADHRSAAQKILLLDPVSEISFDIVKHIYPILNSEKNLNNAFAAIETEMIKNELIDTLVRQSVAAHEAAGLGLTYLAVGNFWQEYQKKER